MRQYSPLFDTLHDSEEQSDSASSVSQFSILRCVVWTDPTLKQQACAKFHTFAIAWDEDHDERIIDVAEKLYLADVIPAVSVLYEHEGGLIVRLLDCLDGTTDRSVFDVIIRRILKYGSPYDGDYWTPQLNCVRDVETTALDVNSWTIPHEPLDAIRDNFTLGPSPIVRYQSEYKYWALEA